MLDKAIIRDPIARHPLAGGAIPVEFITPIDEGVEATPKGGVLAGDRGDDVRLALYDGSYPRG